MANSVWTMQREGRNHFGKIGAWVPLELMRRLKSDLVALGLYTVLRGENGPNSIFPIANAMSKTVGASLYQFNPMVRAVVRIALMLPRPVRAATIIEIRELFGAGPMVGPISLAV